MSNLDEMFRGSLQPWTYGAQRAIKRLDDFQAGNLGYKSGLDALDPYVRFNPGELTVIGARSGTGKTAIGMQIVGNIRQQMKEKGKTGGLCIFSAEMDVETLVLREACAIERVSLWRIMSGEESEFGYKKVRDRVEILGRDFQMLVDDTSAPTLEYMMGQLIVQEEEVGPVELVVFDYTELAGEFGQNEGMRIAVISRGLKAIANRFGCPVIALSQLNRDIEGRENKRPTMRDLMHGGEREPDRIIIMVRPGLYDEDEDQNRTDVTVVKNRNGPLGSCALHFDGMSMRFKSMERVQLNE